jgi:uncharacterized protein YggT (Ycf19 family)
VSQPQDSGAPGAIRRLRTGFSWLGAVLGVATGLLLVRLVLRLFAARPEHPVVAAVLTLTAPFVAPLAALDARQPRFGATLELSTLVLAVVCALLVALLHRWRHRARRGG